MAKIKDVVEAWATQSKGSMSSGNSASFVGRHLHSYGTTIACLVEDLAGRECALVSSNKWSDTTTTTQNLAIVTAHNVGIACFVVPRLGIDAESVAHNINWYTAQIADAIRAFEKCRAASVAQKRMDVRLTIETAEDYAFRFQPGRKTWKWTGLRAENLQHRSEI